MRPSSEPRLLTMAVILGRPATPPPYCHRTESPRLAPSLASDDERSTRAHNLESDLIARVDPARYQSGRAGFSATPPEQENQG